MLHHTNRFDDYFSAAIDFYSSQPDSANWSYNRKLMIANTGLEGEIASALEGMSNEDKLKDYRRAVKLYSERLVATIKKHYDILKKDIALGVETIHPLLKVNDQFKALYGEEVTEQIIMSTPVTYYKNAHYGYTAANGSFPFFVTERFSHTIMAIESKDIRDDLVTYLSAKVDHNNQVDIPVLDTQSALPKTPASFKDLGYEYATIISGITRILNSGEQVKLSENKLFLSTISAAEAHLNEALNKAATLSNELPEQINQIDAYIAYLQCRMVMLSCIDIMYHAVLSSAYNAAYEIHKAEIEYNKSQAKR